MFPNANKLNKQSTGKKQETPRVNTQASGETQQEEGEEQGFLEKFVDDVKKSYERSLFFDQAFDLEKEYTKNIEEAKKYYKEEGGDLAILLEEANKKTLERVKEVEKRTAGDTGLIASFVGGTGAYIRDWQQSATEVVGETIAASQLGGVAAAFGVAAAPWAAAGGLAAALGLHGYNVAKNQETRSKILKAIGADDDLIKAHTLEHPYVAGMEEVAIGTLTGMGIGYGWKGVKLGGKKASEAIDKLFQSRKGANTRHHLEANNMHGTQAQQNAAVNAVKDTTGVDLIESKNPNSTLADHIPELQKSEETVKATEKLYTGESYSSLGDAPLNTEQIKAFNEKVKSEYENVSSLIGGSMKRIFASAKNVQSAIKKKGEVEIKKQEVKDKINQKIEDIKTVKATKDEKTKDLNEKRRQDNESINAEEKVTKEIEKDFKEKQTEYSKKIKEKKKDIKSSKSKKNDAKQNAVKEKQKIESEYAKKLNDLKDKFRAEARKIADKISSMQILDKIRSRRLKPDLKKTLLGIKSDYKRAQQALSSDLKGALLGKNREDYKAARNSLMNDKNKAIKDVVAKLNETLSQIKDEVAAQKKGLSDLKNEGRALDKERKDALAERRKIENDLTKQIEQEQKVLEKEIKGINRKIASSRLEIKRLKQSLGKGSTLSRLASMVRNLNQRAAKKLELAIANASKAVKSFNWNEIYKNVFAAEQLLSPDLNRTRTAARSTFFTEQKMKELSFDENGNRLSDQQIIKNAIDYVASFNDARRIVHSEMMYGFDNGMAPIIDKIAFLSKKEQEKITEQTLKKIIDKNADVEPLAAESAAEISKLFEKIRLDYQKYGINMPELTGDTGYFPQANLMSLDRIDKYGVDKWIDFNVPRIDWERTGKAVVSQSKEYKKLILDEKRLKSAKRAFKAMNDSIANRIDSKSSINEEVILLTRNLQNERKRLQKQEDRLAKRRDALDKRGKTIYEKDESRKEFLERYVMQMRQGETMINQKGGGGWKNNIPAWKAVETRSLHYNSGTALYDVIKEFGHHQDIVQITENYAKGVANKFAIYDMFTPNPRKMYSMLTNIIGGESVTPKGLFREFGTAAFSKFIYNKQTLEAGLQQILNPHVPMDNTAVLPKVWAAASNLAIAVRTYKSWWYSLQSVGAAMIYHDGFFAHWNRLVAREVGRGIAQGARNIGLINLARKTLYYGISYLRAAGADVTAPAFIRNFANKPSVKAFLDKPPTFARENAGARFDREPYKRFMDMKEFGGKGENKLVQVLQIAKKVAGAVNFGGVIDSTNKYVLKSYYRSYLAENSHLEFNALKPKFQRILKQYGITSAGWDILRQMPTTIWDGEKILHLNQLLASSKDPKVQRLISKFLEAENRFAAEIVQEGDQVLSAMAWKSKNKSVPTTLLDMATQSMRSLSSPTIQYFYIAKNNPRGYMAQMWMAGLMAYVAKEEFEAAKNGEESPSYDTWKKKATLFIEGTARTGVHGFVQDTFYRVTGNYLLGNTKFYDPLGDMVLGLPLSELQSQLRSAAKYVREKINPPSRRSRRRRGKKQNKGWLPEGWLENEYFSNLIQSFEHKVDPDAYEQDANIFAKSDKKRFEQEMNRKKSG